MLNLSELENAGVTVKKFCGLDEEDGVGCTGEAIGEVIAQMEDDIQIPIPVCQGHLEAIQAEFDVEQLG